MEEWITLPIQQVNKIRVFGRARVEVELRSAPGAAIATSPPSTTWRVAVCWTPQVQRHYVSQHSLDLLLRE